MIRKLCAALPLAAIMFGSSVVAAPLPYDAAAFQAARNAGKTVVVHVTAAWCPGCAKQKPVIESLDRSQPYERVVVFSVDFDSQKGVVRQLHVQKQSTLIVFKGQDEVARSLGQTDPQTILAEISKGL
jgi:thiol-disulfide isomerase/thioredoxin